MIAIGARVTVRNTEPDVPEGHNGNGEVTDKSVISGRDAFYVLFDDRPEDDAAWFWANEIERVHYGASEAYYASTQHKGKANSLDDSERNEG